MNEFINERFYGHSDNEYETYYNPSLINDDEREFIKYNDFSLMGKRKGDNGIYIRSGYFKTYRPEGLF